MILGFRKLTLAFVLEQNRTEIRKDIQYIFLTTKFTYT